MPSGETATEELATAPPVEEKQPETAPEGSEGDKTGTTVPKTDDPPAKKFAGKYESEDAFAKGINEARKALGLDEVETVIGEGGLYSSPEAAERGYKDLTKLLRTTKPPETDPAMKLGEETETQPDDAASPEQILQKAGLNFADLEKQYTEDGKLSDEQYKAIQKARPGLSRELIDSMADGMMAKAQMVRAEQGRMRAEAADLVGGEDNLTELLKNARSFVPADEIEDVQQRLSDPKRFKGAIRDLKEFHAKAVGSDKAKPLAGGGGPGGQVGAKDSVEFSRLMALASQGDANAIRKIRNTPQSKIEEWSRTATL